MKMEGRLQDCELSFKDLLSTCLDYARFFFLQEIDKVRAELEKAHKESRDHQINQAVELALSHAHADWLKNGDEMRQREIDQAIEVATTNAVAEAKEEWEREIKSQVRNDASSCSLKELHLNTVRQERGDCGFKAQPHQNRGIRRADTQQYF